MYKVLERILLDRLIKHREEKTRDEQAGFRPGRSTIDQGTVHQCPADIVLVPSRCPLTDFEYADDVVIFAESSTKLQHVVILVSKFSAAYGLRLRPDKCKQMWISPIPRTGIRVDGQPIEPVDEFCYLGCMLKNNGSYEKIFSKDALRPFPHSTP
ncbi:hypothetical protein RB195_022440 [Necator americanus]|uniref:Reverse transcriptase domain-containing protein n=1 Tax=Necator americanus TaxID=51031 RepID=A0ABR1EFM0_NECAM